MLHEGRLYFVTDGGLAYCLDAPTGREIWTHRRPGSFIASPILAGNHIFATAESGTTFVFEAGPKFHEQGRNELEESCLATPAISGDQLFLRTAKHLYCIGQDSTDAEKSTATAARPGRNAVK